ncbi:MAG: helix-turn-helix transcriptional regulator [Burkholderiaceae bacterium]
MKQTERLYLIDRLLRGRRSVSFNDLRRELEVSPATLKRDLAFMRERFNAPIVFDRDLQGYRLDEQQVGPQYALPGLWLSSQELIGLLSAYQILQDLNLGERVGEPLAPLVDRINDLLTSQTEVTDPAARLTARVRFAGVQDRVVAPAHFAQVSQALIERRRLQIDHFSRSRNETSEREISAQRLIHYRNAWYLDAWCHRSDALRLFAVDAMEQVLTLDSACLEVATSTLDERHAGSYGIFSGQALQWAELVFSAEAARWVRHERWHPEQETTELDDGRLSIRVPYANSTELEMDILRHGEHVRALAPAALVEQIEQRLSRALKGYRDTFVNDESQ